MSSYAQAPAELLEFDAMIDRGRELKAAGRHQESQRHFEKVLRTTEGMGPVHQSIALEWLGSTYFERRRLNEAKRALVRCLELRENLWGSRNQSDLHHARILTSVGGVELALRQYTEAEHHFDQARHIWKRTPDGGKDSEFPAFLNNMAMLNYAQGRYSEAAQHLREVVAVWQDSVPADDRRLAQAKYNLAGVLSRLGQYDEADRLSSEALTGFAAKMDQEPLIAAELLSIRSAVLRKIGRGR
jgi:tetratricopeptide (TPR) repeat protein